MNKLCKVCNTEHELIRTTKMVSTIDNKLIHTYCIYCPIKDLYILADNELTGTYKSKKNKDIYKT